MTRFIADYEIESHASIDNNDLKLKFVHPQNLYEIHIKNLETGPPLETPLLSVQVILDCEDINTVAEKSREYLKLFLDVLSLVTNLKLVISRLVKVVDWSPGLNMRDFIQFERFPDANNPYEILNNDILKSVSILVSNSISGPVRRALKWFSVGIGAKYPDEQFQYFWFALEILAENEKETTKIPDKCPKCGNPLYCDTCKQIPIHKPYPTQAIQQLTKKTVQNKHEEVYKKLSKIRHTLLHGEDINKKEEEDFYNSVDLLGKVVWTALINSIEKPIGSKIMFIETSTYCHRGVLTKTEGQIGCKSDDKNNPQIEDVGALKISMIVSEREDKNSEDKKTN